MKIILPQTFGCPGAGRRTPTGRKLFGGWVIPPVVMRETTRLVYCDIGMPDWKMWDRQSAPGWSDPNSGVHPRGLVPENFWDEWEEEADEYTAF